MIGTCRLCRTEGAQLCESHILPKWIYKRSLGDGRNRHPIVIQDRKAMQISDQTWEHLLCGNCEQRFCKAENPISQLVYQKDGNAPFLDQVGPVIQEAERVRMARPGRLAVDALMYFGASVLWRASIANCIPNCHLGTRYDENFRSYLLGEGTFPQNASCVIAFLDLPFGTDHIASVCTTPFTERVGRAHVHRFTVFGLYYYCLVGGQEPDWIAGLCINRPPHLVMLAPQDMLLDWLGPVFARARPVAALARRKR